jgi:hypothetical protein
LDGPIKSCFSVYGPAVTLTNSCRQLDEPIELFLGGFALKGDSPGPAEIHGQIRPFDLTDATRSLSAAAGGRRRCHDLLEIYSLAERHWIVDQRWGMCELDLLKHRWRSWVLPHPLADGVRLAEEAALHPMAQLLRLRGVDLVPAISIERAGWGALVIAPYPISAPIARIVRAGYRVIGQRWTALVRHNGNVLLRRVGGAMESSTPHGGWIDLTAGNPWACAELARCDAVLAIAGGRRSRSQGRVVAPDQAQAFLRHVWPIRQLPPDRPSLQHPAAALAGQCVCLSLQLSRHEDQFLQLVEFARNRSAARVQVFVNAALRRSVATLRPRAAG